MSKPVTVHTSVKQQQQPKVSTHILDDWTFTIKEHHIIDSGGSTRELPITQQWQEARVQLDQPLPLDKAKQYDWTYTTDYTGSMTGPWKVVEPSSSNEEAGLDLALLRRRDPISFFANLTLYEDELGDNGLAACNVKLRVMPANGFFILLRFFLRVDQLLVRCYDTRLQWRRPDPYLIREIRRSESSSWGPHLVGLELHQADENTCDHELFRQVDKLYPATTTTTSI